MSTNPIIAIDIDDVLADHAKPFVEFSNKRWGTNLTVNDYDEHWAKMWQVDREEGGRRAAEFRSSKIISKYDHTESAFEVLQKLSGRFSLVVLTSRRLEMEKETRAWITRHYPNIFTEIHFSGIWEVGDSEAHLRTKAEVCKSLGVSYLIDDQLKHCLGASECGVVSLLFGNYTWNQSDNLPKNVIRVKNWEEIQTYFKEVSFYGNELKLSD